MINRKIDEPMLTTDQVSKWLGIAPRTLCTWAELQEIPALKVGRQWRFRRSEVANWLQRSQANLVRTRTQAALVPAVAFDPRSSD